MKMVLILILALAMVSTTTFAGDNEGKRGGDRMARMQEHLSLSDDQMKQIREIRENGGSREEMRAVFTDEQRALMKERRAQMEASGGKGRGGKGQGRGQGKGQGQGHGEPRSADQQGAESDKE